jgi:HD domain
VIALAVSEQFVMAACPQAGSGERQQCRVRANGRVAGSRAACSPTVGAGRVTVRLREDDAPAARIAADHTGSVTLAPAERRLLARMPLHAITSVHGEAGLRERLAIELAACPDADRARAADALALASRLHARDRRQHEPYVNHLLRVTIRILHHYRIRDTDVTCAALLHDAVEDHSSGIAPGSRDDALSVLAARFGGRAAALVAAVTSPDYRPGRDEHQQYREHVAASLDAGPWARVIKASDFTDNAIGMIHVTGPKLSRLAAKYSPLVPVLRELILRPDTPLDADVKVMISGQLDTAQGRFAAIWHGPDAGADQR